MLPSRWLARGRQLLALAALDAPQLDLPLVGFLSPAEGRILDPYEKKDVFTYSLERHNPKRVQIHVKSPLVAESSLFWDLNTGSFAMDLRLSPQGLWEGESTPESALREWCEGWTDSSRIETLNLHAGFRGVRASLAGSAPQPAKDEAGRVRLALPTLPLDLAALLPPGMQRAQSECRALLFPHPAHLSLRWVLDLPANMEAVIAPPVSAGCVGGSLRVSRELEGRRLKLRYELDWGTEGTPMSPFLFVEPIDLPLGTAETTPDSIPELRREVSPADYPAFRALVSAALDPKTTEVLLVPRAKASP